MFHYRILFLSAVVIILFSQGVYSVTPSQNELTASQRIFERILPNQPGSESECFMSILAEDVAEGITRGMSWRGTPYRIGNREYSHGIAFNSTKRILIQLGQPATRFQAEVGLENNDSTQQGAANGGGSIRFHVFVGGNEVFVSPVMRLLDQAIPIDIPLNGADAFEILVDDGGDDRGWDQALWGNAVVKFAQGTVRLQDIPWKEDRDYNPFTFSFLYGDQPSQQLLPGWDRQFSESQDARKSCRTAIFTDPKSKLEVRMEGTLDRTFPAVEWIVYLKNGGQSDTPILENIQALDAIFPSNRTGSLLHWAKGGVASFDDFAPQVTTIENQKPFHLQPEGGRSSNQVLPFFNLESNGSGLITAIGWSGEWAFEVNGIPRGGVSFKAGLAQTHLLLHPGEEIRTPRMLLLNYEGDRWRGQNLLRQYILANHRPQIAGKPMMSPITNGNWGGTSATIHLDNIQKIIQHDLPIEYYWIDAEWYGKSGSWAVNVGDWNYKKDVYPQGFQPLSDALRKSGRELMLWFEPERVFKNTPWYNEHRDWLFDRGGDNALFNLGNPEACAFLIDFISQRIDEFGLGCYRQDFNIDPLPFWQAADTPDRIGMSEIRYIEGLYAFWDGLLKRHPGLIIDNCASGGRRIDLETIGRSTPYWRTDGPRDPIAHQCHTYGLLPWVPFSATSQDKAGDDYEFRSSMCSSLCLNWWVSGDVPAAIIPDTFPFEWAKKTLDQYVEYRQYYYGDYYPLTNYSQSKDVWMAYQLDRPDTGDGLVVVLKRPQSPYSSAHLLLRGLDRTKEYTITQLNCDNPKVMQGKDLLDEGLEVTLDECPDSALFIYRIVK